VGVGRGLALAELCEEGGGSITPNIAVVEKVALSGGKIRQVSIGQGFQAQQQQSCWLKACEHWCELFNALWATLSVYNHLNVWG